MELFPELEKRYTKDQYTAREAQRMAEFIAFGPIVFQASRLLVKYGILELLREHREGLTRIEVTEATGLSEYTVKCLLEAGLCIGTVLVDTETDRYMISKVGWFLLTDEATKVNMDFNNDVNYEGFFHLDESFREHRPAGLKCLGDWDTIYEGLSTLPEPARTSWFAFDHFYSNNSFEEALKVIFDRPVRNLLDVGGNTGKWALQCVGHDPDVEVTILDLPQQIRLMRKETSGKPGAERIHGCGGNLLDPATKFPSDKEYDVIWMSQFLDCFSEEEVISILTRVAQSIGKDSKVYIMETLWDRQRYETASYCLTQISLYFPTSANGNSKMFHSDDLIRCIENAGLEVEEIQDNIGLGHSILQCRLK